MNDLVQHQQLIKLAGVSEGITHKEFGSPQHPPKFSIGDEVVWAKVSAHDYGVVVDRVWTTETVHKVTGWHYLYACTLIAAAIPSARRIGLTKKTSNR